MKLHQEIDEVFSFFELRNMYTKKIFFLFFFFTFLGQAQTKVGGKVIDEFDEPNLDLISKNIAKVLKGTKSNLLITQAIFV